MLMLKGKQISLRALEPDDIDVLYSWENNPENWLISETTKPFSRKVLLDFAENAHDIFADKQLRLIIEDNGLREPIGAVDLFDCDFIHQRAGVGILISHESRKKGSAAEALELLADYARNVLGFYLLSADVMATNEAGIKLFEKAGYVLAGRKRAWIKTPKGRVDLIIFQKFLNE